MVVIRSVGGGVASTYRHLVEARAARDIEIECCALLIAPKCASSPSDGVERWGRNWSVSALRTKFDVAAEPVVEMNAAGCTLRLVRAQVCGAAQTDASLMQDPSVGVVLSCFWAGESCRVHECSGGGCRFGFFAWRLPEGFLGAAPTFIWISFSLLWAQLLVLPSGGSTELGVAALNILGCDYRARSILRWCRSIPSCRSSFITARRIEPARILEVRLLLEVHSSPFRLQHRKAEVTWSIA
jgi:hypothetical protein